MPRLFDAPGVKPCMPDAVAFREAVQSVEALGHPRLAGGKLNVDKLGLPTAYTGRFAVVFRLTDRLGVEWALRFFTTPERSGQLPRALRYALIDAHLEKLPHRFVEFQFHERGIRVGGSWEPLVAMGWAQGRTLGRWVAANVDRPERLRALAARLEGVLQELEAAGIAHGDWQHDNLLLSESGEAIVFVDYDGMFVPELAGTDAPERGHPNYQHPARSENRYGVGLDRFACLVIQTALLALAADPNLETRFGDPDRLLFSKADLEDPARSRLFATLRAIDDAALAERLSELERALSEGEETALLPAPTDGAAPSLTALGRLARAQETDPLAWERAADTDLPWWRAQVASRHIRLDPRWAELLGTLERTKEKEPALREAIAIIVEEQRQVRVRLGRVERALQKENPELALGISRTEFVAEHLRTTRVPYALQQSRLETTRIDTAAKLLCHADFLPKFLRERERAPLLAWAEEQRLAANAAYDEKISLAALEDELAQLYEKSDALGLAHARLSNALAELKEEVRR